MPVECGRVEVCAPIAPSSPSTLFSRSHSWKDRPQLGGAVVRWCYKLRKRGEGGGGVIVDSKELAPLVLYIILHIVHPCYIKKLSMMNYIHAQYEQSEKSKNLDHIIMSHIKTITSIDSKQRVFMFTFVAKLALSLPFTHFVPYRDLHCVFLEHPTLCDHSGGNYQYLATVPPNLFGACYFVRRVKGTNTDIYSAWPLYFVFYRHMYGNVTKSSVSVNSYRLNSNTNYSKHQHTVK